MRTRNEINNTEWFGHMPDGWEMKPLKSLFSIGKGITVTKADLIEHGVPVVNYGQVHSKLNDGFSIHRELIRYVSPDIIPDNTIPISKGGFIFASTSEDLKGCGNCIYLDSNIEVYAGGDTTQLIPLQTFDNKYFAYLFSTDNWRSQIRRNLVDVKVFHVNPRDLKETYVAVPPRDVQNSIVSFLDSRCKSIDEAITRHQLIINKLEDYRRAIIKNAVTFGLNDEPLKNTGIPWIKSVPKTWNVMRVKDIAKLHNGSDPKTEGSVPVYGSGKGSFKSCGEYKEGPTVLLGRKGTVHVPQYIEGKYWNVDTAFDVSMIGNNNLRYFYYLATCFNYGYYRTNTARPSMTQSDYENMKIAVPLYKEQIDIASYLDYKCAAVDEGVARQEQVIAKLEEYRRSLIFHAVTGRIDCTGGVR